MPTGAYDVPRRPESRQPPDHCFDGRDDVAGADELDAGLDLGGEVPIGPGAVHPVGAEQLDHRRGRGGGLGFSRLLGGIVGRGGLR